MNVVEAVGFILDGDTQNDKTSRRTMDCEYTADSRAMMQWIYKAEFWVARKPK